MDRPTPQRLGLVVNPTSGRGRAERLLPRVTDELRRGLPAAQLDVVRSTSQADAVARCEAFVDEGVDALLVMGGDGMAHVGLNAAATTGVPLGVIPAGTGNDFCRGMGLPRRVGLAVQAVVAGRERAVDLARLTRPDAPDEWVGSVLSTGYDARVNRRTNAVGTSLGPLSQLAYAGVALAELATFRPLHYRLVVDGALRELDAMFVAVANAGCFGGGMQVCPDARVDDGLLDVLVVHPMGRGTLLRLLPQIFSGGHAGHPTVEFLRARTVRVDGGGLFAMADGEEMGPVPVEATCAGGVLRVLG